MNGAEHHFSSYSGEMYQPKDPQAERIEHLEHLVGTLTTHMEGLTSRVEELSMEVIGLRDVERRMTRLEDTLQRVLETFMPRVDALLARQERSSPRSSASSNGTTIENGYDAFLNEPVNLLNGFHTNGSVVNGSAANGFTYDRLTPVNSVTAIAPSGKRSSSSSPTCSGSHQPPSSSSPPRWVSTATVSMSSRASPELSSSVNVPSSPALSNSTSSSSSPSNAFLDFPAQPSPSVPRLATASSSRGASSDVAPSSVQALLYAHAFHATQPPSEDAAAPAAGQRASQATSRLRGAAWEAALRQTAGEGFWEQLQGLLERGVDPNSADASGKTALHLAAEAGDTQSVTALLDAGVDATAQDGCGKTALHYACEHDRWACARQLLERAVCDPDARDDLGWRPLHLAARAGHLRCLASLLKAGADKDAKTSVGYTALHWAAFWGHVECVRSLLAAGASPNERNANGRTALDLADSEAVRQLFKGRTLFRRLFRKE